MKTNSVPPRMASNSLVASATGPGRRSCSHATSRRWDTWGDGTRRSPWAPRCGASRVRPFAAAVNECAWLLQVHVSRGELDEARALLRVIEEQAVGADLAFRATQIHSRAQVARADGHFEEALELATNGIDVASEIGNRDAAVTDAFVEAVESAFALKDLATVDALLGRMDGLGRANARPSSIRRSPGSMRDSTRSAVRGVPKPASRSPPRRSASATSASTSR